MSVMFLVYERRGIHIINFVFISIKEKIMMEYSKSGLTNQ